MSDIFIYPSVPEFLNPALGISVSYLSFHLNSLGTTCSVGLSLKGLKPSTGVIRLACCLCHEKIWRAVARVSCDFASSDFTTIECYDHESSCTEKQCE